MTGERPGPPAPGREGGSRRRRRAPRQGPGLRAQGFYLAVAGGVLLGLLIAWKDFRAGAYVMAASMLLGAGLRAALPEQRLGFLVTRKKGTDVITMAVLGAGLAFLAFLAPRGG